MSRSRNRKQARRDFAEAVLRVSRAAAAEVVADGSARLEEGQDLGGEYARLVPLNPRACEIKIYPDYPTLCMGPEQHCTEMFGSEEQRLRELPQLIRAVISGRYEWRHRQVRGRFLIFTYRHTQLVGTFLTAEVPWVFTRQGVEPEGAVQHKTYEPYRRPSGAAGA